MQALVDELSKSKRKLEAAKAELEKKSGEYEQLASSLRGEIEAGRIELMELRGRTTVKMKDKILFASGSATIGAEGRDAMRKVAEALRGMQGKIIRVEGHTDNVPTGSTGPFPSNWELSAARALAVVHFGVWWRDRHASANLSFSLLAVGVAFFTLTEFEMMRAGTPAESGVAQWWVQFPIFIMVVGIVAFIRQHFGTGRAWLGHTAWILRAMNLAVNLWKTPNVDFDVITGVTLVPFLGEPVAVAEGGHQPLVLARTPRLHFPPGVRRRRVGRLYRHRPQTLKVQEYVKNGSLGTVKLVHGSFSFLLSREGDVRLNPEWGGGSIWDVGCYPISYARSLLGQDPLEVFGWQVTGPTGIDETFAGQMRFAGDVFAQFDCSFALPFHTFMEIVGSEATLNIPRPFKPEKDEKVYLSRNDKTETIKIKGQELYIGEVEDMADAILLGKAPRVSLDDSRANVLTIASLLEF